MTNLETKLLEILTRGAVRLFPVPLAQMRTALIREFNNGFAKKRFAGPYGSYDNINYVLYITYS